MLDQYRFAVAILAACAIIFLIGGACFTFTAFPTQEWRSAEGRNALLISISMWLMIIVLELLRS